MAFAQSQSSLQDRRGPATIGLNFSSNNPFRAAASPPNVTPAALTPGSPGNLPRKPATNPFLDDYKSDAPPRSPRQRPTSPLKPTTAPQPTVAITAEQLDALALNAKPQPSVLNPRSVPPNLNANGVPPHPLNSGGNVASGRRPIPEEERRRRMQARGAPPTRPLNIFADINPKSENRRPAVRRNSDSSIMEVRTVEEDERRRRERRRERAEREGKDPSHRSRRPNKKLDLIDRLDLTGMYGGAAFHHDGPFDACNPQRNRKGRPNAPMQAFPEGSTNMALGGSGPINKNIDFDHFHGRQLDAFADFSNVASQQLEVSSSRPRAADRTESFNATDKVEQVHGDPSLGLGTSTFLEGAPASRAALQRRTSDSEGAPSAGGGGGLHRKKSLAQKLRIKPKPADRPAAYGEATRVKSPENWPGSPPSPLGVQSAGGRGKMAELNPFFNEASSANAKATVDVSEAKGDSDKQRPIASVRPRTATSPSRDIPEGPRTSLESTDGYGIPTGPSHKSSGSGGFLNRVKSIKGKRSRPERGAA